jgi:hypothetical protein
VCSYRSVAEACSATESEAAPAPTPCQQLAKHVRPHTLADSATESEAAPAPSPCQQLAKQHVSDMERRHAVPEYEAAPAPTPSRTRDSICTFVLVKQVKRGPGATRSRTRATAS